MVNNLHLKEEDNELYYGYQMMQHLIVMVVLLHSTFYLEGNIIVEIVETFFVHHVLRVGLI